MTINQGLAASKSELDRAQAGMRSPRVETLKAGQALFRFASTVNPATGLGTNATTWARGAWWLLEADYRKILLQHQAGALGLGTVARAASAVQPSWSRMDVSIKAYLHADIEVYLGRGKTQYRDVLPNGMYMTLTGWPDIDQVYIPGLRNGYHHALLIVRQKVVTSDGFGY